MPNEIENEKINTVRRATPQYRIKSYVIFLILVLFILLFVIFLGRFGNDVFALLTFSLIFLIPVIILFRNSLPSILPSFINDSLFEIDNTEGRTPPVYSIDKKTEEQALLFGMIVLIIASMVIIADYREKMADGMTFYRIMSSVICLIFAGIMLGNITGEELKITFDDDEEEEGESS